MRRPILFAVLLLAACAPPEPTPPPDGAGFAAQAREMQAALAPWQPWFEELKQLDQADRYRDVLCQRRLSQRVLWDDQLAARLAGAATLVVPEGSGPLLTLADLKRQLDGVGVDLLVVFVPPSAAIYPEHFGDSAPPAAAERPPLLDRHLRDFYAALEAAGVEVLDLLPALLEHRYDGPIDEDGRRELIFHWQDVHWTTWGTEIAAGEIARRVRRYPWFDEVAERQGRALFDKTVSRERVHGSIVRRLIDRGRLPADTPKELRRRVKVRIRGELWSFNDRDSPIVLLGDSFSLPRFGLPDQLLENLGFRVDAVTVAGGLPTGGPKALAFRGDRLAGKRLVIWEVTSIALAADWRPVDVLGD
jgi:alginate O-acetyltransferase complex protein AlgJ